METETQKMESIICISHQINASNDQQSSQLIEHVKDWVPQNGVHKALGKLHQLNSRLIVP